MAALFWNVSIRLANSQRCRLRLVAQADTPYLPSSIRPIPPSTEPSPLSDPPALGAWAIIRSARRLKGRLCIQTFP